MSELKTTYLTLKKQNKNKHTLDRLDWIMKITTKPIIELYDTAKEIVPSEKQRERKMERNKQSFEKLCNETQKI